jgi:hypothetical protein
VRRTDASLAWAALDLVSCLLLVVYTLIAPPRARTANVVTMGAYAIILEWPRASRTDLDLYVQDPAGNVAWYGQPDAGALQLEHDDLGAGTGTSYNSGPNFERTVVRTTSPGTYAAVVHLYCEPDPGPTTAVVELWKLGTAQRPVDVRRLTMEHQGDEQTAFRWTVDQLGDVVSTDRLAVSLRKASGVGCSG